MKQLIVDNKGDKLFTEFYPNEGKETVILLHGGPGFPLDFKEVAEVLGNTYQVINFHQRGTRQSPCPSGNYSMEAYVSDIEAVAGHFNLQKFHLFGYSWGGAYAQLYTQHHPERLLSLYLFCPASGVGDDWRQTQKEILEYIKSRCASRGTFMRMLLNNAIAMAGSDSALKRLYRQLMVNYNEGFVDLKTMVFDFDNLKAKAVNKTTAEVLKYPVLDPVPAPAFKVGTAYAEFDLFTDSKETMFKRYPTAATWTIENSGHLPWLHNPARFKQVVRDFYGVGKDTGA